MTSSSNIIFLFWSTIFMFLQWPILEGDGKEWFVGKSESFLGGHFLTHIEHIKHYTERYKLSGKFGVTVRRCKEVTEHVHMVRVHLYDIKYPWRWDADWDEDNPDIELWAYVLREFIFFNQSDVLYEEDFHYREFQKVLQTESVYSILWNLIWIGILIMTIGYVTLFFAIPTVCRPIFSPCFTLWQCFWNTTHRRFWRGLFVWDLLWDVRFQAEALPISVERHITNLQGLVPENFREMLDEGEPVETVEYQGTVFFFIDDDSDSQCEMDYLMDRLYDGEKPRMELINMYKGVRVNLRKQPEHRHKNWDKIEGARLEGIKIREEKEEKRRIKKKAEKAAKKAEAAADGGGEDSGGGGPKAETSIRKGSGVQDLEAARLTGGKTALGSGQKRTGDKTRQKRILDKAGQKRILDKAGQKRILDKTGQKRGAEVSGQKRNVGKTGKKRNADAGGQKPGGDKTGQKERADVSDHKRNLDKPGQKGRADVSGQKRGAGKTGQKRNADVSGQKRIGDKTGQKRRAGVTGLKLSGDKTGQKGRADVSGHKRIPGKTGQERSADVSGKKGSVDLEKTIAAPVEGEAEADAQTKEKQVVPKKRKHALLLPNVYISGGDVKYSMDERNWGHKESF